jgi:hypothetical protein
MQVFQCIPIVFLKSSYALEVLEGIVFDYTGMDHRSSELGTFKDGFNRSCR